MDSAKCTIALSFKFECQNSDLICIAAQRNCWANNPCNTKPIAYTREVGVYSWKLRIKILIMSMNQKSDMFIFSTFLKFNIKLSEGTLLVIRWSVVRATVESWCANQRWVNACDQCGESTFINPIHSQRRMLFVVMNLKRTISHSRK